MTSLLVFIIYIVCGILVVSAVQQLDPFYHLPSEYHFDEADGTSVRLTDLVCVKGNNARSFKFKMRTSSYPKLDAFALIGMYVPT
jgi:cytochrome c-type biogenesis protein CcmE